VRLRSALLAAALLAGALPAGASLAAGPSCDHRVLVLSAMPLELNPLVAQAALDPRRTVHVDDRTFYVGRLAGLDVVLALTGIGPVNATRTATTAFERFRCPFAAAVFSGVAGSSAFIGDVVVPQRWTADGGRSWVASSPGMYAVARRLRGVPLSQDVPVGDAACLCAGPDPATPVHLPQRPQLRVGGSGETSDPFGGHPAPCVWGGGDVAGCEPCLATGDAGRDTAAFAGSAPGFPQLVQGLLQPPPTTTTTAAAQDEETGAVAVVARRYGVPFLGVRGVSDGRGDPLGLPGFPFQFAVYRQLAGNNAAAVTTAFLRAWAGAGRPV
jgi:nucleoside phosphorylase